MSKYVAIFALMLMSMFSILLLGMTLIGQALPYKGEIRYFLQRLNNTTPYSMDALRGLAYPMRLPFPASQVEWSPNNDYIIVWMGNATYLTQGNTTPLRLLSTNRVYPQWSPDRQYITFDTFENSFGRVYLANGDGTDVTALMPDDLIDYSQPSFSPDGTQLVYVRGDDLYLLRLEDNVISRLTNTLETLESTPYWSPDGQHIAFLWREALQDTHLGVIDADGQNRRDFTNEFGEGVFAPYWSPDSTRLSFFSYTVTGTQFFTANILMGDVHSVESYNITNANENLGWSADGTNIIVRWAEATAVDFFLYTTEVNAETGALIEQQVSSAPFYVITSSDESEFIYLPREGHTLCVDNDLGETVRCFPIYKGTPLNFRWLP